MNKKILFIFPNTANRPLISMSIPILCGISKYKGWDISYFDTSNYEKNRDSVQDKELTGGFMPRPKEIRKVIKPFDDIVIDLQEKINQINPDIIAITAMTCDYEFLMKFWPNINANNSLRIIGGFHATVLPKEVLSTNLFDIVCFGQGEGTFIDILEAYENKISLKNIKGIYFKEDIIVENDKRKLLNEVDIWKIPNDYSLFNEEYFEFPFDGKMIKMCQVEASRGCPFHCSYCGNDVLKNHYKGLGKYLNVRPFDSLFELVKKMIDNFNIEVFSFTDECFMGRSFSWLEEFCERWKYIKKPFLIQSRPEYVNDKSLKMLVDIGSPFIQIGMGVESGSHRILYDVCDRKISNEETIRAYDLIKKYPEIRSNAYFMIGFPTETREEMFETIKLCKRIDSKINSVAIYQPFPGQRMRDFCIQKKYISGNEPMQTFTGGSILKQPHITANEIYNLWRCFLLYAKLPEEYYDDIKKCEFDYDNNKDLYNNLVNKRWELEKEKNNYGK